MISVGSSDEHVDQLSNEASTQTKPQAQRSNTTVHVCWHRNTSISMGDELLAVEVIYCLNIYGDLLTTFVSRTNFPGICCENLKAATVGRSSGWSLQNSACSSTRDAWTIFHWPPCHCWATVSVLHHPRIRLPKIMCLNYNIKTTYTFSERNPNILITGKF